MGIGIWDAAGKNKRDSILLFFFFFLFLAAVGWLLGQLSGLGNWGLIIAFVLAIMLSFGAYYNSDKIVLKMSKARPATKEEHAYLKNTVEGLAIAAGIPTPKVYVIDDPAPNAFATGRNPEHGVVCVTTGLMKRLNRSELEGVIAHEIAHIKNYDIRFMTLVTVMLGTILVLSQVARYSLFFGGGRRGSGKGGALILIIGLIMMIVAPIIAAMMKFALSRQREYLSDSTAALLTRYPEGLASALEKLESDKTTVKTASEGTAHLYIINPLKTKKKRNLFSTHPPIEERVKRLRAM